MTDGPEQALPGGRSQGAVRVGDTVRRPGQPWTPAVHALLAHLAAVGFEGAPRPLGYDDVGRAVVTYLPGQVVAETLPWPPWIYSDAALDQVGRWLRRLHDATTGFVPPPDAVWFAGQSWRPGLICGHHDAAPYNAVWSDGDLVGFVDWDTAGPSSRELDLAFVALTWVPMQAPRVVVPQGFHAFDDRPKRLQRLLDAYGFEGDRRAFPASVAARARINADAIRRLAAAGSPIGAGLLATAADLDEAVREVEGAPAGYWERA